MNWVGGSRSRIILKQERRKQKEYFERKKLKSKMKLLEVSSPKSSAVSLDLLNLYVVNQISTKKENTGYKSKFWKAEDNISQKK
ncbi:regulator of DNA class I crossover intermediates 1 [Ammospiza maritima maritima]